PSVLLPEHGPQCLADQSTSGSPLRARSPVDLPQELAGKRNHHLGHGDCTSRFSVTLARRKGNTSYIPSGVKRRNRGEGGERESDDGTGQQQYRGEPCCRPLQPLHGRVGTLPRWPASLPEEAWLFDPDFGL